MEAERRDGAKLGGGCWLGGWVDGVDGRWWTKGGGNRNLFGVQAADERKPRQGCKTRGMVDPMTEVTE
jgi:hypothetical protein